MLSFQHCMYDQIAGHQMQIGAFIVTAYKSHFLKMIRLMDRRDNAALLGL